MPSLLGFGCHSHWALPALPTWLCLVPSLWGPGCHPREDLGVTPKGLCVPSPPGSACATPKALWVPPAGSHSPCDTRGQRSARGSAPGAAPGGTGTFPALPPLSLCQMPGPSTLGTTPHPRGHPKDLPGSCPAWGVPRTHRDAPRAPSGHRDEPQATCGDPDVPGGHLSLSACPSPALVTAGIVPPAWKKCRQRGRIGAHY